ncbi:phage tail length tape measure family protein [Pelagerythrobacter marinus]|nr:phage tail length tape measure family protein [Pelagerythrobacter marinus]
MAGVPAGRLSIEIVAEVARLQQDLDKAKRAVKAMSNDIARDARAANDNLSRMGSGFERAGQRVTASAGAQRMGMQQLSMQLNDVATMYALGARPMQIFASQSGQVLQAVQLMSGGTSKFATFMMGPWGMALTTATIVLTPFIAKLFEAEEAAQKVEFATNAMGDAQSILGGVMDLTTGKINTQSEALLNLARAQAIAGRVEAQRRSREARGQLSDITRGDINYLLSPGSLYAQGRLRRDRDAASFIAERVLSGDLKPDVAINALDRLGKAGKVTENSMLGALQAVANLGVEAENIKVFEELEKALDGDRGAVQGFLNPKKSRERREAMSDEEKALRDRNRETERFIQGLDEEIAKIGLDEKALRQLEVARALENAVTARQRADIAQLNAEREKALDLAEKELRLKEAQKETDKLTGGVESVRREAQVFELVGWARQRALLRLEREAEVKPLLTRQTEALARGESALAEEIQKQINLLNERYGLEIQMGDRLDQLARWEERYGRLRDFLADLNKTPDQMNQAFEDIQMRGLDAFNDGLVDAIINFRSLGDMASNVMKQILADLLRLQIRKSIIGPLADMLGLAVPSSGAPVDLLSGTPYGGARANGGPVVPGNAYLVGERGREMFVPDVPGHIVPNDRLPMAANDRGGVMEIRPSPLFEVYLDGKLVQAAPAIAQSGAQLAAQQSAFAQTRRIA